MAIFRGAGGSGDAVADTSNNSITAVNAASAAEVSAAAAAASATSASNSSSSATTSASNATTSATNAATSATTATTKAAEASTSATNAATSASTATTKASEAATSASNASTSASTATTKASEASTSATSAANSATTATTQATSATTSATSASGSATTATTQAGLASTSASNAATSASAAATSATNAATSATAASGSATTASTQATNAAASATTASTQASNASTSATSASSSATTATTQAGIATTKASEASTSATNAAASATTASTQAANASSSATSASGSATTATTQAGIATTGATTATTQATNAATSATSASGSATTATTQAGIATTQATNAATSASIATTQAGIATTEATSSATSAAASAAARDAALAALDSFDDRYLGSKSVDPTLDNDGNALVSGALYFNTGTNTMKVYDGTVWLSAYATLSGALLAVNNLSDITSTSAARTNLGLGTLATQSGTFSGTSSGTNTGDQINISGNAATATTATTANATAAALTAGTYLTSGGTFNGSTARTFAVDATTTNTASKVVARDASGNFSAGTITAALTGNVTGNVTGSSGSCTGNSATATTATNLSGGSVSATSGVFTGDITVGNGATSSNIYMGDADEGQRQIHCNSNRIGFLTQAGAWGAFCDDAGNWGAANFSGFSSGTNTGDQTNISGNAATATNASQLNSLTKVQMWNNSGQNHNTYQSFGAIPDFGVWFMQNSGAGDAPQSGQFYTNSVGLGNDYPYSQYAMQTAVLRNTTNPYQWIRYKEGTSWGAWTKTAAGYADTAGGLTGAPDVTVTDLYANSWIRNNNNNTGLYNQTNGNHFYSRGGSRWGITGNSSGGEVYLDFYGTHETTYRGSVIADASNNMGFLNSSGNWSFLINSLSDVLIGTTAQLVANNFKVNINSTGTTRGLIVKVNNSATPCSQFWVAGNSFNNTLMTFTTDTSQLDRGSIVYNRSGGVIAYNTTSDYRAKDIIGPVENALEDVSNLKVHLGMMKGATQERPMFVAHELEELAPYAVVGEKDAVDDEDKPIYQQVDVSTLVPLLTKAIQELKSELDLVKAELNTLKENTNVL